MIKNHICIIKSTKTCLFAVYCELNILFTDLAKLIAVSQVINKQNNTGPIDSGDNAGKEEKVPNHLPPKQQELFKRIQQQQRDSQPSNDFGKLS